MIVRIQIMVGVALTLVAVVASATTLHVPTEFRSVHSACEYSAAGDTVAIAPGEYLSLSALVRPGVTIMGLGADSSEVKVHCDAYNVFFAIEGDESAVIENLTISGGYHAGLLHNSNSNLVIRNCYLEYIAEHEFSTPMITVFKDITISDCHIHCSGYYPLLVMPYQQADITIEHCIIDWEHVGWDFIATGSSFKYKNNTFLFGYSLHQSDTDHTELFISNIFPELYCPDDPGHMSQILELRYNDIIAGEPHAECGYQVGNIAEDPLYCVDSVGVTDYQIQSDSPCLGAGENGENIGARGECIYYSSVDENTVGTIRTLTVNSITTNPSNSGYSCAIQTQISTSVSIDVLDLGGRVVHQDCLRCVIGRTQYTWDGKTSRGTRASTGVYFIRFRSGSTELVRSVKIIR